MKQIKRLKREKVSLFLAAAVLSLGILSGCGAESNNLKSNTMKNTVQRYGLSGNFQIKQIKKCVL